ncbi:hypothetical protein LCGC14_2684900 [marine sediment metagenome]|uniref:Methyltransferase type 11 domain-containing protein n=1 Tax=marine sediment metagenome TaxID=412755 RepID=A0A0F9BUZ0_9ZZZZ
MKMGKYKEWKEYFQAKNKYSQNIPYCFYDLAGKYLPENKDAIIIDIGCGRSCEFENHLNLWDIYKHIILLDGNKDTIAKLIQYKYNYKRQFTVLEYIAPGRIPLDDKSVDYIYCSHMIEHLYFMDVYNLLKEFDRVLKSRGILVIRSAMLWFAFYETFDHIKPYPPLIFIQYLCGSDVDSPSYKMISNNYEVKELVYRYNTHLNNDNRLGSSNKIIDFLIQGTGCISRIFRIRKYKQTGYTIILRKNDEK